MTFVELLSALALLVLVITLFTPMLLDSYNNLYRAGELNEKTYDAKSNMETELAERDSNFISRYSFDIGIKIDNVAQTMFLNMRKAMESVQNGIQTVFYGGKGTIRVVSPSTIPDDSPLKEITILFNGINVDEVVIGDSSKASKTANNTYTVAVQVIPPVLDSSVGDDLSAFQPKNALTDSQCSVKKVEKEGKQYADITITDNVDVVTTVIKIIAYYIDENGENHSAEAYVRITPATIMLVGDTSDNISYYTSKGVDKKDVVSDEVDVTTGEHITETVVEFEAYGRELRTLNNPSGTRYTKDTRFLSVNFIDNDKSPYLEPYYVLTGTNGTIQRLFIAKGKVDGINEVTGYTTSDIRSIEYKDGGVTKKLYPTFWGGDRSHQFGFSSYKESSSYGSDGDDCWYTQDSSTKYKGSTNYDRYAVQTRMAMFYNGFGTEGGGYNEICRNGRKISYIIMEKGIPLRLSGIRKDNSWGGFVTTWEYPQVNTIVNNTSTSDAAQRYDSSNPAVVRVDRYDKDWEKDSMLAYLNLKSYGNLGVDMLFDIGDGDASRVDRLSHAKATELNVSASLYNSASGKMMYLGSSVAYAYLQQVDNINGSEDYARKYQPHDNWFSSSKSRPEGGITGYLIQGNVAGGTTIKKATETGGSWETSVDALKTKSTGTLKTNATEFYVQRPGTSVTKLELSDVEFTLGYSSNREQVFANVTFGTDLTEYHNSYERYYNLTHYGDLNRSNRDDNDYVSTIVKNPGTYINSTANDMYNVWFPGEFYNLTKTATRDGITIAVGYTVSGSTYQWVNPNQSTNTSTALGSVYNDGVLAIMTNDDESFKNILYFKDTADFTNSDITSDSDIDEKGVYAGHFGTYGTHARRSVRFTAVDIYVLGGDKNADGSINQKSIYAVYGDNHGRLFFSLVAQVNYTSNNTTGVGSVTDRIGDAALTNYGSLGAYSSMIEFTDKAGKSLSTHFSEITNITVDGTDIYVTGRGNGADQAPKVAICNGITKGDMTFTVIDLVNVSGAGVYLINDMLALGGYLYFAGEVNGTSNGFWCAVNTTILNHCADSGYDSLADYVREIGLNSSINDTDINPAIYPEVMPYQDLPTRIYSIAGRNT